MQISLQKWRGQLLRKHKIPNFFFINKIDRQGADLESGLKEIRFDLTQDIYYIQEPFNDKNIPRQLIEFMGERDEILFEKYIEESMKKLAK